MVDEEAASLVEVVVAVARLLPPPGQRAVSDVCWELMDQTEPQVTHTGLVRALMAAHVTLRGTEDLPALRAVAGHVQEVIGKAGDETQAECSAPGALHDGTAQLAAMEALRLLEGHLAEGEELMAAAVRGGGCGGGGGAEEAAAGAGRGGVAPGGGAAAARSVGQLVEALCRRLAAVVDVLQTVVQTRLGNPQVLEVQTEVLIKTYKLLGALAKAHLPTKGSAAAASAAPPPPPLGRPFHDLVARVHRDLTPPVYAAVGEDLSAAPQAAPQAGGEEGGGAMRLSSAKLRRDAKSYSRLVHAIEDWEKQLLALEKAFKAQGVNLMRGAKRSTNRDFKIMAR
ncbi:hypothetical protein PLESTB_000378800 [Pleodorina starrii]|uniref:FANCI solenoid 4 domain-containing protein n=1 Tax=Pleodorina starrii TaxID=330485 RepID=A0A9W6BE16_9CHLO|nr:hypothetical protein PLESTB_000378700 [Pleodorina starrii]GLC50432.1 hypothetical protein PLESTB_000378800 [Pleodorina starrii]